MSDANAFLMLKPDAVRQELLGVLGAWLGRHGLEPVELAWTTLDADSRVELYSTSTGPQRVDWDLNQHLYDMGEVIGVRIERIDPGGVPAWQTLSDLKGHFVPQLARAGTLRAELGALNPIWNTVHASDSAQDSAREWEFIAKRATRRLLVEEVEVAELLEAQPRRYHCGSVLGSLLSSFGPLPRALAMMLDSSQPLDMTAAATAHDFATNGSLPELNEFSRGVVAGEIRYEDVRDGAHLTAVSEDDPWRPYLAFTTLRYLDLARQMSAASSTRRFAPTSRRNHE